MIEILQDVLHGRNPLAAEEIAKRRLQICESCPEFKKVLRQCSKCSCFMDLKTKLMHERCPLGKW